MREKEGSLEIKKIEESYTEGTAYDHFYPYQVLGKHEKESLETEELRVSLWQMQKGKTKQLKELILQDFKLLRPV